MDRFATAGASQYDQFDRWYQQQMQKIEQSVTPQMYLPSKRVVQENSGNDGVLERVMKLRQELAQLKEIDHEDPFSNLLPESPRATKDYLEVD